MTPPRPIAAVAAWLLCLAIVVIPACGQGWRPVATWGPASIFQEGKELIIQGGSNGSYTTTQSFAIDLSSSWNTSSVTYKSLASGPNAYMHTAALLQDGQRAFVLSNGTAFEYSVYLNLWKNLGSNEYATRVSGIEAVTDPDTGLVYVPNGYIENGTTQMLEYDAASNVIKGIPMHPSLVTLLSYSAAWSASAKKLIVFGGATASTNNAFNTLYTWDSVNNWQTITATGEQPAPRRSACLVPAYGGAKMVLYGGLTDQANSVLSDIFFLDTQSWAWTKGTDAGISAARAESACAVTNDLFVSWGGGGAYTVISSNLTIVYNMKTNLWQSTYSPDPYSGPLTGSNGSGSSANTGAIVGGVIGGVAVLALAALFCVYRRKKRVSASKPYVQEVVPHNSSQQGTPIITLAAPSAPPAPPVAETLVVEPVATVSGVHSGSSALNELGTGASIDSWHQQHYPLQPIAIATQSMAQQPQPVFFNQQSPYTPIGYSYQPPIIHDYQSPTIFQPPTPTQPYTPVSYSMVSSGGPPTTLGYSPQLNSQSTIYQFPEGADSKYPSAPHEQALLPQQHGTGNSVASTPPTTERAPQNPQYVGASDGYVDIDGLRRNPQEVHLH